MGQKITSVVLVGGKVDKELLQKCLKSIDWTDEVIQVNTAKVKGNFSEWRNEGIKRSKGDWILYVDTDEEVTSELRENILKVVDSDEFSAYAIPRRNFIFGKEFKRSGQWPDYQKRLFLKSKLKEWKGKVHEEPVFEGIMGHLKEPLVHRKHNNITDMVDKTNDWSEIEAELMFDAGHPKMNIFRFFSAGAREFYLRMIRQMAFLDGVEGIIYALYQVFSRLVSYSKLWELQLKNK